MKRSHATLGCCLALLALLGSGCFRALPERMPAKQGPVILLTLEAADPLALPSAGGTADAYQASRRYAVGSRLRREAQRLSREYSLVEREDWLIPSLELYCVAFEIPAGADLEETMGRLRSDARVESVQQMQDFATRRSDPYAELQHGLETMRVPETHRWVAGRGVRVAVIDTAVDMAHPDLQGRIQLGRDFVGRGAGPLRHAEKHGTAVAGIIASSGNEIGTVGVAPDARLLALRGCWEQAGEGRCSSLTLLKAISFAIEEQADLLNMSLSGPEDPLLARLIRKAIERGAIVVAAGSESPGQPDFPASVDGVIAVTRSRVSGRYPGEGLQAPGSEILAAQPGGGFDYVSGSSFAAANATGVLALLRERAPDHSPGELERLLRDTSTQWTEPHEPPRRTIDACLALARLDPLVSCSARATATASSSTRR